MANGLMCSALSVLGGAAAGAVTMFLLDPEQGDRRRQKITGTAEEALNTVSDKAHTAVGQAKSAVNNHVQFLADRAEEYASRAHDRVNDARQDISDRANSYYARAKSSVLNRAGLQEKNHRVQTAAEVTVGSVGVLAVGAGLMYFLDPQRGNARRAWARDKIFSWSHKANQSAAGYTRHVGNKLKGVVAEVKRAVPEQVSDAANRVADAAVTSVQQNTNGA